MVYFKVVKNGGDGVKGKFKTWGKGSPGCDGLEEIPKLKLLGGEKDPGSGEGGRKDRRIGRRGGPFLKSPPKKGGERRVVPVCTGKREGKVFPGGSSRFFAAP